MKQLYLIGGAMGAGKSAVGSALNRLANKSVWLDGEVLTVTKADFERKAGR